jgi:N4-gp56 family major capsid protein
MKDFIFNLQRFADPVVESLNKTTSEGLSAENKVYYEKYLIDNAKPNLVHSQFGQKRSVPKHGGKTVEFRKYSAFEKAAKLQEGITPVGKSLSVSTITASLEQYGDYVAITDVVDMTAIDDNLVEATELLGDQAGLTLDSIPREVMNGGTNVLYAGGAEGRVMLTGGITVADVKRAATILKAANAKKIEGSYVGIVHPYVSHDLTSDPAWIDAHKYSATEEIFEGEIGKLYGVRFVETSEAKVFKSAGSTTANDFIGGEDGGAADVFSTLILGADAYGCIEHENGNLKHIFKNFGSGGTSDPLDQRATAGWKAYQTAVRLVEDNMVRIESLATAN